VHFVRCYNIRDNFKESAAIGTFCGRPVGEWLSDVGARLDDAWPHVPDVDRTLWTARLFPAQAEPAALGRWLWMYEPAKATATERRAWLDADRYSLAEVAELADQDAFHDRRAGIRASLIRKSLRWMFRAGSDFSAAELAFVLAHADDRAGIVAQLLGEAQQYLRAPANGPEAFLPARLLHTLSSAIEQLHCAAGAQLADALPGLAKTLSEHQRQWLSGVGLSPDLPLAQWCAKAKSVAFETLGQTILGNGSKGRSCPRNSLRKDEIV
jgi:hypothetical protein